MTNKVLFLVILIIVLAAGGVAGFFYWQQTKPLKVEVSDNKQNTESLAANTENKTNEQTEPTKLENNNMETTNECKRNFDQNKLSKSSGIKISGRVAEIDVKGFGKIALEFYDKDAPKTVENFLRLADSGYFDCLTFHRVAKGFVIQGGDPNGNGTGGFSAFGAKFEDELNPATPSYKAGYVKGVLAMANSGPNTNGSQFFIMLADNQLPNAYTIFGKVSSGMDVVDKIGKVDITPQMGPTDGTPKVPVVMQSVKIIK